MAEETYCTLTPAPGATHAPDTVGGPWTYEWNGDTRSIFRTKDRQPPNFDGKKMPERRGLPRHEAERALDYFTPPDGGDPLVEIEYHQGEPETVFAPVAAPKFTDPATGISYDSVEELTEAITARLTEASGPKPEGDPRTPGNPSAHEQAETTAQTRSTERPADTTGNRQAPRPAATRQGGARREGEE
jgi:hypothetical protein